MAEEVQKKLQGELEKFKTAQKGCVKSTKHVGFIDKVFFHSDCVRSTNRCRRVRYFQYDHRSRSK